MAGSRLCRGIAGLRDLVPGLQARAALCGSRLLALPGRTRRRPGQNTVEYLLMLAVVAGATMIFISLFHKRIIGGFFTLIGMIIGAGQPK